MCGEVESVLEAITISLEILELDLGRETSQTLELISDRVLSSRHATSCASCMSRVVGPMLTVWI